MTHERDEPLVAIDEMSLEIDRTAPHPSVAASIAEPMGTHRTLRQDVWRQFRRHKGAVVGLILLTIIVLSAIVGPAIYPYDPFGIDVPSANQGPSWDHILGTDNLGRDVMARLLIGGRISLAVGFAAAFVGLVIGTGLGLIAGFFRRWDGPLMRLTDLFLALPILPLLLVVRAPRGEARAVLAKAKGIWDGLRGRSVTADALERGGGWLW